MEQINKLRQQKSCIQYGQPKNTILPIFFAGFRETKQSQGKQVKGKSQQCPHDQYRGLERTIVMRGIHPQVNANQVTEITEEGNTP